MVHGQQFALLLVTHCMHAEAGCLVQVWYWHDNAIVSKLTALYTYVHTYTFHSSVGFTCLVKWFRGRGATISECKKYCNN